MDAPKYRLNTILDVAKANGDAADIEGSADPALPPADPAMASPVESPTGDATATASPRDRPRLPDGALRDRVVMRLVSDGAISVVHAREAVDLWERQQETEMLWRVLARHPRVDREAVFAEAASTYAFAAEPVGTGDDIDIDFVRHIVESLDGDHQDRMLAFRLLPVRYEADSRRGIRKLIFATHDPMKPEVFHLLQDIGIQHFELRYAAETDVATLLDELFPRRNEYLERIQADEDAQAFDLGASYQERGSRLVDEDELEAEINRSALINLFEATLVEGVRGGASDIHIFPNERRQTEFHMRVDGVLTLWHTQDKVHPESMLAVVKDRCMNVDRFDRDAAQDGYIQRTVDDKLIRFRVSILPIATSDREVKSESIVIRILDDSKVFTDLSAINLHPVALKRFERAINQPHGMVIMTGPTGSGKSTTLAAALHGVISPQRNVLTIEDPVEYIIQGARQIKLGPRLNLEGALRSILRHDPDVVMVGEMRDRPTAELAIKLANTGHLTFSTLHTNDAPSAVSRLFKMGIEPFLIGYAINLVVAQRLLRKLCPTCRDVDPDPDPVLLQELGFTDEEIDAITLYRPGHESSCRTCSGQSYKGRQAIAEALYFSRDIRHQIVDAGDSIDEDGIRSLAIRQGMMTLQASAREVVKRGETSVDEMIRVVASE
ncbi:GspE/PulE family protein [Longibacter sp.]|uniref:GspE/PulE family protein n=1 Tax=Longibacter sp. TaxID=2045415 RepID=UPI003EBFF356